MSKRSIIVGCISLIYLALAGCATTQQTTESELSNAQETVQGAANVVAELKANPDTRAALQQAKAVFIVPNYKGAAFGVGGSGGQGVLVANNNGNWSAPAFYHVGGLSLGLQAGAEAGQVAFLIMSDKALADFRSGNNFSLNAKAGLTVINWSQRGQAGTGPGADVIAWTNTKGLYGALAVGVSDVSWNEAENNAYYKKPVSAEDIIAGQVKAPPSELTTEFSALESAPASNPSQMKENTY